MSADEASTAGSSLLLIAPETCAVKVASDERQGWKKLTYWAKITCNRVAYSLRITDPLVMEKYGTAGEGEYGVENAFVCVSLTKVYAGDGRCHKLAATVFLG